MRTSLLLLALGCSLSCAIPQARAQDRFELFGGYSYVRASVPVVTAVGCPAPICSTFTSTSHPNLNGWELAATYKPISWFGLTGDFSGHYGTLFGSSTNLHNYLFGPTVAFPGPVSPFVHLLVGGAHLSFSGGAVVGNAFASALGAGIDIKVAPFVSLRPIQIDYLLTRFNSSTQNQPRVSAGLVLRF